MDYRDSQLVYGNPQLAVSDPRGGVPRGSLGQHPTPPPNFSDISISKTVDFRN